MDINLHNEYTDNRKDSITSLLNFACTRELIIDYIAPGDAQGILLLIDIDNLKFLNEMLGFYFGDQVISSVAKVLTRTFRNSDIIGRVSGDRFAVFMKGDISQDLILFKANEVCREVQKIYCGDLDYRVSASVGVACYPKHGESHEDLWEAAEIALKQAKEGGKNLCRIYETEVPSAYEEYEYTLAKKTQNPSDYETFYNEISKMTFRLMEDTVDADKSIQMLMQRIMDYFGFAVIATLLVVPEKPRTLKNVYTVVAKGVYNNKNNETQYSVQRWNQIKEIMERGHSLFRIGADDPECRNMFPEYADSEIVSGIRIPMGSKTFSSGLTDFVYIGKEHEWEEREIRLLESFTKILSVYIGRIHNFDETAYLAKLMRERDSITGLFSYEMFLNRMKEIIASQTEPMEIAYTYSDFSNFKYINETYGYNVGNLLLRKFGELVSKNGDVDFLCASRLHSDNIIVARKNATGLSAERYVELVDAYNEYITKELRQYGHDNMITIRTGVYVGMSDKVTVEEAVTNAGYACKKSKEAASAKAMLFTDSLMEEYRKRLRYISELDVAIRTGQMQVYIQPKTAADGVRVVGGEALVRWIKPDNQMVFPGDFIPIFEKSGDIITLDYFVYKEVFKYQRNRLDNKLPVVPISVNVSKLHLKNDNLQRYLERLFVDYKMPVELIELELTENVYIENMDQAMRLLNWCKNKHIKIAMDDFGSGYSSLNMLDQVSVDIMKIDKTFLKNEVLQKNECIILEHVVSMADKMDIITVCEGVESKEQLNFLAEIGCNVIQGYYVGKPMPMKDFDQYLETHVV